jgi:vacuolar-type H+-ATPase subunit E/Vma4
LKAITMAESADRQARRESLERELQNVRSIIRALREAVGTTPEQNEAVFQLE